MKQHITEEQLAELTFEQQMKLHKAIRGDIQRHPFKHYEVNIGQMIELLETEDDAGIEYYYIGENGQDLCWLYTHSCSYKAPELCDALFEAVKQVLGV